MLTVTDRAVAAICDLTGQPEAPDGAGLRIATDADEGALTLALSAAPLDGDAVLEASGARIFLDTDAARMLDGKALDAVTDDRGGVRFAVASRPQ